MDQTKRMKRSPSPTTIHHQNRWIRGFSRIGLVLACIVAFGVLGIGAFISIDASRSSDYEYNKRACLLAENGNRRLEGAEFKAKADASGCGYFSRYATYQSLQWQDFGRSINENGFLLVKTSYEEIRARVLQADGGGCGCRLFSRFFDLLAAGLDFRRLREELAVVREIRSSDAQRLARMPPHNGWQRIGREHTK